MSLKGIWDASRPIDLKASAIQLGEVIPTELGKYDGQDPFRPILLSLRGKIYDVSSAKEMYGPGGSYALFAGKECARALGKMTMDAKDCSGSVEDLTEGQMKTLHDWEEKFRSKYPEVGKLVEPKRLTLAQLKEYDGSDKKKPIYLAIRGVIFDVSKGAEFYGPDGMYPFAGHECARAFALISTDTADCHDNLEGLGRMEMDNLRDWEAKFNFKYPIVGSLVKG
ncbi:g8158 [Coccomyxa viridis]|uniref:G8158 protein n=1 Tax=Coccomyxa viridis TaxID=1274662 RepID=A0ABP1FZQ1_9CHLO